jgi:uncharacterized lipoprotein YddW (UPF0748 family)
MRKSIIFCFITILFLVPFNIQAGQLSGCGLFVTVLQDPPVLSSNEEIIKLVDFARKIHAKTLYVQIYRANKAWFLSKVADSSPYYACLKNTNRDPFAFLLQEAHRNKIEVYAWLNLLSLSNNKNARLLEKYGTDILTRNTKPKRTVEDYKIDSQYFLEPGDLRVRNELSNMVGEVLRAYPGLDGILFDYIRYPDVRPAYGYTKMNLARFKKTTGIKAVSEDSLAWKDWKRRQVNDLLRELALRTRSLRPEIKISATGCAPYYRAYHEAFQDWPSWISAGIVDSVTFMSYSLNPAEFKNYVFGAKAKTIDFSKVNIAVGAYKLENSPQKFSQEFDFCKESGANTCIVFHYGNLVKSAALSDFLRSAGKPIKPPLETTQLKRRRTNR